MRVCVLTAILSYLGVSSIAYSRTYFRVNMYRALHCHSPNLSPILDDKCNCTDGMHTASRVDFCGWGRGVIRRPPRGKLKYLFASWSHTVVLDPCQLCSWCKFEDRKMVKWAEKMGVREQRSNPFQPAPHLLTSLLSSHPRMPPNLPLFLLVTNLQSPAEPLEVTGTHTTAHLRWPRFHATAKDFELLEYKFQP